MRSRKRKKGIIDYDIEKEAEFLNNKNIRRSILKIGVVLLIICLNSAALFEVGTTLSYFSDKEESLENKYNVGTLDFLLESSSDFYASTLELDNPSVRNISVVKIGSLDFQYNIEAVKVSGDDELCNILQLEALLDGELKYQGALMSLDLDPLVVIGGDGQDDWAFNLSLPALSVEELKSIRSKTCQFDLIFNAQQADCPECSLGFLDTEKITNNISTGDWNPEVTVIYPNGGEVWYMVPPGYEVPGFLGTYEIEWTASSPLYDPNDLIIDIWFCKESGNNCFYNITDYGTTENDGSYWWTIPYDPSFITSEARMKIIAYDPDSFMGEDFSDEDFCPPMLDPADVLRMMSLFRTIEKNVPEAPAVEQGEPELQQEPQAESEAVEPETPLEPELSEPAEEPEPETMPEEQEVVEEESPEQEEQIIEEDLVEEVPAEEDSQSEPVEPEIVSEEEFIENPEPEPEPEPEIQIEEPQAEPEPEPEAVEPETPLKPELSEPAEEPEPETMPEEQEVVEEQPVDLPEEILVNTTDEVNNGGNGDDGHNESGSSDTIISE